MELTYDNMKKFMEKYCKDYSLYGNDADTMPKMDEYWAPNFVSTAYFTPPDGTYPLVHKSRKEFQEFLINGHKNIKDALEPRDVIIDQKNSKAVILLKIKKENRNTAELTEIDGVGIYKLIVDANDTLKIKSLDFFWHAPQKIIKEYKET